MKNRAGFGLLAAAITVAGVASCSLFTSLDGLQGGDDGGALADAGVDGAIGGDAGVDGATPLGDSGSDAQTGDAGAWAFIAEQAATGPTTPPLAVDLGMGAQVGDLVIVGCDSGLNSGYITIAGYSSDDLILNIVGPHSDGSEYTAEIGWGVVKNPIADLQITGSIENPGESTFLDCSVNLYRGGSPNVSLVQEMKMIGGEGSALNATCGPIQTAVGGVAYYIAARTTCVGTPIDPAFNERTEINGNPNGDIVPTDGGMVQSVMNACSGSTSSWICYMMSLTP